jgi:nucleoside-diphosphate-sugar epimerase
MKHVLVLGACGNIGPHFLPHLEPYYHLHLTDVKPHPQGKPVRQVDITRYDQVFEAMKGMDALINLTVVRSEPALSFEVNVKGAWNAIKAAAEHGVRRVIHTGPQSVRTRHDGDFDVDQVPEWPGTGYYGCTKFLSEEIYRIFARVCGMETVCFKFNGLGPKPTEPRRGEDFPPFVVVWEDLAYACRLALEVERVPDGYQNFNLLSYPGQGKFSLDSVGRVLGYAPLERLEDYYRRPT